MTSALRRAAPFIAALLAAPWVAWAIFRGFELDRRHPLIALVSFTPYVAMTSPLPVMAALMLRRWVIAAGAIVAAVALALAVLPRAADGDNKAPDGDRGTKLVVMTSNLYFGEADPRRVMELAREHDVDVLSLQEVTATGVPGLDRVGGKRLFPHRLVDARGGAAGSALLARRPLRPSGGEDQTGAAQPEGEMTIPGSGKLRVKVTHPPPPTTPRQVESWRYMMRVMPGPRDGGTPRILAGDFNATLDHSEFRRLVDRGWYDAADATGDGLKATWQRGGRLIAPSLAIDHILVPPPIKVRRVSVHDIPGSDHNAVIAELVLLRARS